MKKRLSDPAPFFVVVVALHGRTLFEMEREKGLFY
jgi:hypothetical protein